MATQTQTLSTVPMVVNIDHYGGDTLPVKVVVPASYVAGRTFDAQVRRTRGAEEIDATFDVAPGDTADEWFLTLPGDVCSGLVETYGVPVRVNGVAMTRYTGVWDCQISNNGADPIKTLIQGTLSITLDVTRR